MTTGRPTLLRLFYSIAFPVILVCLLVSCSSVPVIVKRYPAGKPFVYQTNIKVIGNFTNEERDRLASRLKSQLDDSMKSRAVSKVFWAVMKNPPAYDSINASRSIAYFQALLTSLGYFKGEITYQAHIDTVKTDQFRTRIDYTVTPGKQVHIDSFAYRIADSALQQIAVDNQADALVKKGSPFAKTAISSELDRLVELYRQRGYMRFGREDLYGLWDTLDISLLRPAMDPLEQIELLEKIKQRRENPTANLEIKLKPGTDPAKLRKYYVGNITIYPDYTIDSTQTRREEETVEGIRVISLQHLFKPKILPPNIYLKHGELYDQRNYFRTINRFNSLGAWRLVNIEPAIRSGQDTADFTIKLNPATKYSFTTNLEGSRNSSAFSGNLFGLAVNVSLQNRNFARRANQSLTNFRFGIETGRDTATDIKFLQTQQLSLSHVIHFPRAILVSRLFNPKYRANIRTSLSIEGAITLRRELYDLRSLKGSWGYDLQLNKWPLAIRFPNIEFTSLSAKDKLLEIFTNNPSLRRVFNDGLIASVIVNASTAGGRKNRINALKLNGELSGFPGIIRNKFFDDNLYRFIKADAELVRKNSYARTDLVFRLFAGVGYEFNSTVNPNHRFNLPFFRQYFAGGPNSMRAWGLRKLGPGSSIQDFGTTGAPDRYGDMQLEGNIEYRFPLANVAGVKIKGALFTDAGNIWFVKNDASLPAGSVFRFSNLAKDIAIGTGMGVRVDFSFFVIRLDFSHKVKDPSPSPDKAYLQNKWFGYVNKDFFAGSRFQLGIGYPFTL